MSEHIEEPDYEDDLESDEEPEFDALVIGAGAAGVGAAGVTLCQRWRSAVELGAALSFD